MSQLNNGLSLSDLTAAVRRRAPLAVILTGLVVLAAAAATWLAEPKYTAVADVLIPTADAEAPDTADLRSRDLQNELSFARSDRVRVAAESDLGTVENAITIIPKLNADLLFFAATASEAVNAADVANAFASAYLTERAAQTAATYELTISALEGQLGDLESQLARPSTSSSELESVTEQRKAVVSQLAVARLSRELNGSQPSEITTRAVPPGSPVSPVWSRNLGFAVVLGAVLGLGVSLVAESTDRRITTASELERSSLGLPVLGLIPRMGGRRRNRTSRSLISNTREVREAFRFFVSAMAIEPKPPRSILVTSALEADGKTTAAVNLAAALARSGSKVVLVDADLRKPSLHPLVGDTAGLGGVVQVLRGAGPVEPAVEIASGGCLFDVIVAGGQSESAVELLSNGRFEQFLGELQSRYDVAIVDAAPLLPVGDTLILAAAVDAALLVVNSGKNNESEVSSALDMLARSGVRVIGSILTNVRAQDMRYGYGYGVSE